MALYILHLIGNSYKIQKINTNTLADITLKDIIFNTEILNNLSPEQACYVGLEYAKTLGKSSLNKNTNQKNTLPKSSLHFQTYNQLLYQTRERFLGFLCGSTGKEYIMDPKDIASSEELLIKFNAAQAFYIGLTAGLNQYKQQ